MSYLKVLSKKIEERSAIVGIIGIGYVGGALAQGSASRGFKTIGFTRRESRAKEINDAQIKNYTATTEIDKLSECDIVCICVPTPIHEDKSPDLEPLENSLINTAKYLKKGTLVIIESTIAPGMTRNFALPILKTSGLREENEFFVSFSPERVDPGNKKYTIFNTPKVVSGLSNEALSLTSSFYKCFIKEIVPVSSLEAAEMSKMLENTFRLVNISLSNELLNYTDVLGIDLWEVITASSTKPFGFMAHYPGPGIGGHCIPVDPYYLLADAKKRGISLGIVEAAGNVNDEQPKKIVKKTLDILKSTNGVKQNHSALVIGVSYKENVADKRESPSLKIRELLRENNVQVSYHDPYIPSLDDEQSVDITEPTIQDIDIIIIATSHSNIDYDSLVSYNKPILDTRNILKNHTAPHIFRI
ncbi:MAG: hypothetical protein A3C30_00895 [Candidatus Levybacteria bacterium RIFCSPHIGHO2_02_FULL_40_18]|nr:MAG: hypothetical protein A2869_03040 [Candidatus Levybacteria bacterium RIFCSPHIGHO2_01_FULL_40_58]OGH27255.1 MAG: hypothetical protein A3C30_00895 [Candidatus Levybacteria bacterium RIFCSPHIGHO2_02_FULL_40_18]OGH31114.1 MAG: hypothetical protein A3E43_05305 [Candidatus Levybacteria bacterium RIFCSPHIGHO2_12_FULL_40_31]OGH40718.1 MAG: hypothetical protein A2894_03135 [Candidatus Levybacteria bacterium RIFCSPLOWO2_01_FULL_40_64]OGH49357.1 MAG: hypothetical protein A3I54_01775 [Candidatus Lev